MRSYIRNSVDGLLRSPRSWLVASILLVFAVAVTIVLSWGIAESSAIRYMVRDALAVAQGEKPPWFTGWFVYVGSIGWFGSAVIGAFIWLVLFRRPGRKRIAWMFLAFSGISLFMGVDDLFMLHDGILWFEYGIGESKLLWVWLTMAFAWGLIFLPELLSDRYMPVFAGAVVLFAFGLFGDVMPESFFTIVHEEGAKLGAVILWTGWAVCSGAHTVSKDLTPFTRHPRNDGRHLAA